MLRRLYDWTMDLAARPYAMWALFAVAFIESSFFPIPPDVLIIPMVLANRPAWLRIALVATLGSVLGGLFGYWIGAALMDSVGQWVLTSIYLPPMGKRPITPPYPHVSTNGASGRC